MAKFSQTEGLYKKESDSSKSVLRKSEGLYEKVNPAQVNKPDQTITKESKQNSKSVLHS